MRSDGGGDQLVRAGRRHPSVGRASIADPLSPEYLRDNPSSAPMRFNGNACVTWALANPWSYHPTVKAEKTLRWLEATV
ncbi:hypothetical protein [Propionivibrio sp.]|uniref:hypothetical protein n=1 Tax=Propionivibrio sp. TaxID=2212460 RepID=UPI0025D61D42|nr:hypothetical protein [Propionivibrio sp.]MBK7357156.1 hypothetical protein [Propionivibrio sp.]